MPCDRATGDALLRALPEVALSPVRQLASRHLAADDFDRMLAGDVVRDLLRWMGNPDGARNRMLRCFIESEIGGGAVTADLRLDRPNGESVAATPKSIDNEDTVSLVLAD